MKISIVFLFSFLFMMSGCLGDLEEIGCGFLDGKNQDHCYQDAAMRQEDPDVCAKIKAESFSDYEGPAPRDKCYLRIASETGDPSPCSKIEGGMISYTPEECYWKAALKSKDPNICNKIEKSVSLMFTTVSKENCLAQLGYEEVEEEGEEEETTEEEGECRIDSDCTPICEGDVRWKRGCMSTKKCEKTFDFDCSAEKETFGGLSFGKECISGGCVRDTAAIAAARAEITEEANKLSADMDTTTKMMMKAQDNCINGLSDVTNKLIIDTALLMASPPSSLLGIGSSTTNEIVNKLSSDPSKMSPEEFIAHNCNLVEPLDNDISIMDKKRKNLIQQARELDAALG